MMEIPAQFLRIDDGSSQLTAFLIASGCNISVNNQGNGEIIRWTLKIQIVNPINLEFSLNRLARGEFSSLNRSVYHMSEMSC
jgi:hypothetical protein